ncbi:STAS domain-containing protein [Actinomadura macra]|uniref:STAS domain-containing protein n=1 Tax=Actinomadura macra TaxID=46164 RepID=UPI000837818D|nr:STAS domain-containing protein [Actinomadura macra]
MLAQPTPQPTTIVVPPVPSAPVTHASPSPDRPRLTMSSAAHDEGVVLTMTGHLVSETVVTAEANILTTIVLAEQPLRLALDLSRIDVIDAQGANLLTKARFTVRAARGTLYLIAPEGSPARRMLNRHLLKSVVERREDLPPAGCLSTYTPTESAA